MGPMTHGRRLCLAAAVLLTALASGGCGGPATEAAQPTPAVAPAGRMRVVFFGDSLTAGLGVSRSEAFPSLVQTEIDAAGLPFEVVNAGVSGDTTADGLRRLDWALSGGAELVVLELGANDGLRGLEVAATRRNLADLMGRLRARGLPVVLVGMRMPPNYGPEYTARFREVFPALATEFRVPLVPFLMEGVGGKAELLLSDGTHPNAAGHRVMARTVWSTLGPVLRELATRKRAAR